jgi:predicted nucleic acid-binding protein
LDELERVLNDKLKMPAARVRELTAFIRQTALIVKPKDPATWPASDPDDQWIVATALCGEAQILVSGDRDLQNAPGNIPIEILTPREFWERLK